MSSISPPGLYGASPYPDTSPPANYTLNSNIMVAAIFVLFFVVFLILMLHLYARWLWHRTYIAPGALQFVGVEAPTLAANTSLDKAAIAQLPTFVFSKSPVPVSTENLEAAKDMNDLSSAECAVCLSEFEDGEEGRMLPSCKHAFHVECIDMWFQSHSTCPLCRTVVSPSPTTIKNEQTQSEEGGTVQAGSVEADTPLSDGNREDTPASTTLQDPRNVLFYGNQAQVSSHMTSALDPSDSHLPLSPSSSGRAHHLLHITIDIPSTNGNTVVSPSPHGGDQAACKQPLKSPSLCLSIKRMLSRQWSEGSEEYQKGTTSAV